jgi:hypothetical protein
MPAADFDRAIGTRYMLVSTNCFPQGRCAPRARSALPDPSLQALTMLLLDRQSDALSQASGAASGVRLRLRTDGQLLDLAAGKTTIGSSPRCNVRIQHPGVQPLHCLIFHGEEGLQVRSWAGNTKLNGVPFQESALGLGDCLSLGPVELDVIDSEAAVSPSTAIESALLEKRGIAQVRAGRDLARRRSRQLLDTLRRERNLQRDLQSQVCDLQEELLQAIDDGKSIGAQLEKTLAELAAVKEELAEQKSNDAEREELVRQNEERGGEIRELTDRIEQLTHDLKAAAEDRQKLIDDHDAFDERHRRLANENSRLQHDIGQLTNQIRNQKSALSEERDELRRRNEQLVAETRALAAERAAISDDRSAICRERSELQECNEELQARIAELNERNSAAARDRLTVVEQRDALGQQSEVLQARIDQLTNENAELAACKLAISDEQTNLRNEIERLANFEREMQAVVAGRESTSEELQRALLQIAELKERDDHNRAHVEVYETLSEERDQLLQEVNRLRGQLKTQADERASIEAAWIALSNEATAASELPQRLAEENSKLLAELDEAKRHLEKVRQDHAALSDSKENWEREQAAKAEADAAAAATVADIEKKLAQQAREYAESISELEQQLAGARDAQRSVEQDRDDWQRKCAEVEGRCAEQSVRIVELERQLTDKGGTAKPVDPDTVPIGGAWDERPDKPGRQAAEDAGHGIRFVEFAGQANNGLEEHGPAEYEWPYLGDESTCEGSENASNSDVGKTWNTPSTVADELHSQYARNQLNGVAADAWEQPATVDNHFGDALRNTAAALSVSDECNPTDGPVSESATLGAGEFGDEQTFVSRRPAPAIWPTNPELRLQNGWDDEATSLTDSSFLNQAVLSPEPVLSDRQATEPNVLLESGTLETTETAKRPEPTSFIERYSHLFTDDEPAREEHAAPITSQDQFAERDTLPNSDVAHSPVRNDDEEESIEQYMAKLLQRVRGDAANRNATVAQLLESSEKTPKAVSEADTPRPAATVESALHSCANDGRAIPPEGQQFEDDEPLQRKTAAQLPTTDLGALRALANETARRAIGRHDVRKHRRDAVKKLMIATMAGLASGWLMLKSRDWQSLQFITGGIFLLVAAFWGGQTCRALWGSHRAASYDGPESEWDASLSDDESQLPIDVEERV